MTIDRGECACCGWIVQNRNPRNDLCSSCDDSKSNDRQFTFSKQQAARELHKTRAQNGWYLRNR